MADDVVAAGLFPSQAIYRSSGSPPSQLRVYDPESALKQSVHTDGTKGSK